MKVIGITGGVGAGKSTLLEALSDHISCHIVYADEVARELMEPGTEVNEALQDAFPEDLFNKVGMVRSKQMAAYVFGDEDKIKKLNSIVHPAVRDEIEDRIAEVRASGDVDYFFIEAALLIECGYREVCDELWYVRASEKLRSDRLKSGRGYDDDRIASIFNSQLSDKEFEKGCDAVIENDGDAADMLSQAEKLLKEGAPKKNQEDMQENDKVLEVSEEREYVFGLDIGTRNVVGTVGYKDGKRFNVIAMYSVEHESRAMIDGQIHDIGRVSKTIGEVKDKLEEMVGFELTEVCIAAAGRVLRTVTTRVAMDFEEETVVSGEDINTLDLMGIDQAQQELSEGDEKYKFYCVGYSVMKYYLDDEPFSNLEGHRATHIEEIIIVTFLPQDVVDGLYSAVERVGLSVANMTLEPIAATNVAVPENFRMLNIALVDVGAGTSDICLTKEGSIIAYGMIPYAGDELTEVLVQHFLVDFAMAEKIKKDSVDGKDVTFTDIMGLEHTVKSEEVWEITDPVMEKIVGEVADKIKELNGGESVAATFVVGGGGKVHGFTETLSERLGILKERVALRGEEVMGNIDIAQDDIQKDSLIVTPIGICLNYYEQRNNFIMIRFNGEMMKLYDNGHLRIVDAALQAGVPTEELFPRRGAEINFTVNGTAHMARGVLGESAVVKMNGQLVGLNTKLIPNSSVEIEASTAGGGASMTIEQLDEFTSDSVTFVVNGQRIVCPKFVEVNGILEPSTYIIREGDAVETRAFYTVGQLAEFMDIDIDLDHEIIVNNRVGDLNSLVYDNFTIEWTTTGMSWAEARAEEAAAAEREKKERDDKEMADAVAESLNSSAVSSDDEEDEPSYEDEVLGDDDDISTDAYGDVNTPYRPNTPLKEEAMAEIEKNITSTIHVTINDEDVTFEGQKDYIFSDIFTKIDFDTTPHKNKRVVTRINGTQCGYADPLHEGDRVEIRWEDR
ncbi:MAG: dephospho-CoA kinase [Lachnospiraceae bacterium]|nr:dephospho-CoA kinase [Lachnospiraceae bacterium]